MIHHRLTHYIGQIIYNSRCNKSSLWNIEQFNLKCTCYLNLVIRQLTSHCDCIDSCSYGILSIDLEFRIEPVEIYDVVWKHRYRRHWVTLVPILEWIVADHLGEEEIGVVICLLWVINYIPMVGHWVCHYVLVAAQVMRQVHACLKDGCDFHCGSHQSLRSRGRSKCECLIGHWTRESSQEGNTCWGYHLTASLNKLGV